MIVLDVRLDASGCMVGLESRGHGSRKGSSSPSCALVSGILGSFGRLLTEASGFTVRGAMPGPGLFGLQVDGIPQAGREWFRGASSLVLKALQDVRDEFPDDVQLTVIREKE